MLPLTKCNALVVAPQNDILIRPRIPEVDTAGATATQVGLVPA